VSPPGHPKGEQYPKHDSAKGTSTSPPGRPKGEQDPKRDSAMGSLIAAPPRRFAVPTLAAERVTLRPLSADDVYALFAIFSDVEVARYWSRPPMTHLAQARAMLRQVREGYRSGETLQFGIERKEDAAVIGTCTLFHIHPQSRRAELGYALGSAYWRQGYMHEALQRLARYAFEDLDLIRLEADIDPRNEPSERTLLRLGFVREGYMRERWIVAGVVSDSAVFGLLRREWRRP
jgi:RimJ/RimL family protein N-acetyltransferase